MSPAVAAVVKSVYCDDSDDIDALQQVAHIILLLLSSDCTLNFILADIIFLFPASPAPSPSYLNVLIIRNYK